MTKKVKVFSTTGSWELAQDVCKYLRPRLLLDFCPDDGVLLGKTDVKRFSNENVQVQVENVRGRFVAIIHSQVPPVDANMIELFALLDAVQNAHPADVLLIFSYMPYVRSDRKNQPRISTMGRLIPQIIWKILRVKNVILLDPHDSHIKEYFKPSADEITAIYLLADYIEKIFFLKHAKEKCVVVFADSGAAKRYEDFPHLIDLDAAYIDKGRKDNEESPDLKKVVGDVRGKTCIVIDDEILTGRTSIGDAELLIKGGAESIYMFAVHPVIADKKKSISDVVETLEQSPISGFVLTDSIPVRQKIAGARKFEIISVAPLLAEAIKRTVEDDSLTYLHDYANVNLYRE
jgi:ribose-phosphate pyrophosphokinase